VTMTKRPSVYVLLCIDSDMNPTVMGVFESPVRARDFANTDLCTIHASLSLEPPKGLTWKIWSDGSESADGHAGDVYAVESAPLHRLGDRAQAQAGAGSEGGEAQ